MPTPIHEIFLTSVTENIRDQLKKITTGTSRVAADFAKNVDSKGSIALKYEVDGTQNQGLSRVSRHEPDGTFKHREAQDPSIIIEISCSQKRKALTDLAEFYILGSDGNIQRVIGLDIEYKATKRATLSVWQPEYIGDEGSEELVATQALVAQVKLHLRSIPRRGITNGHKGIPRPRWESERHEPRPRTLTPRLRNRGPNRRPFCSHPTNYHLIVGALFYAHKC